MVSANGCAARNRNRLCGSVVCALSEYVYSVVYIIMRFLRIAILIFIRMNGDFDWFFGNMAGKTRNCADNIFQF